MSRVFQQVKTHSKPIIETEHLLSSFEHHYGKVINRQLLRDNEQVKKKYANYTALGEGENTKADTSVNLNTIDSFEDDQTWLCSDAHGKELSSDYMQPPLSGYVTAQQQSDQEDLPKASVSKRAPLHFFNTLSTPSSLATGSVAIRPREIIEENNPGGGISFYTIAQKPPRVNRKGFSANRTTDIHKKRYPQRQQQQSSSAVESFQQQQARGCAASELDIATNQICRKTGQPLKQNQQLLNRMLNDDEQFRQRLLKGYLGKHSGESLAPQAFTSHDAPLNAQPGQNMKRRAPTAPKLKKSMLRIAPSLVPIMSKVSQVYQGQSTRNLTPSQNLVDIATNHTSEAPQAPNKRIFGQDQNTDVIDIQNYPYLLDHFSAGEATNMNISDEFQAHKRESALPNTTKSRQNQVFKNFKLIRQPTDAMARAGLVDEQIFRSLDHVKIQSAGRIMTSNGVDMNRQQNFWARDKGNDASASRYGQRTGMRLRRRPITGARQVASHKSRKIAANATLSGDYRNRQSQQNDSKNTTLFKTLTQREQQLSGNQMVLSDKSLPISPESQFLNRNPPPYNAIANNNLAALTKPYKSSALLNQKSNETQFNSNQQCRQSEGNLVTSSLQNVNPASVIERAKSSMQNRRVANLRANAKLEQTMIETANNKSSRGMHNFVSAVALSQIPPRTNVPVLDNYFEQYDTLGQIGTIKFSAEFGRLAGMIKKFWKLKGTGSKETEKVKAQFEKMMARGEAHQCPESEKETMLACLTYYLELMKEYYETEIRIQNLYQEREKAIRDLIQLSQSFHLEIFQTKSATTIQKLRMLTVKIVFAVKRWKELIKRATATFTVGQAREGTDVGRQVTAIERGQNLQPVHSFQTSRSGQAGVDPMSYRSSREKFSNEYLQQRRKRDLEDRKLQSCILCYILKDNTIQSDGSLLIKKLACFTIDSIVFTMKASADEARKDIDLMATSYKNQPAFQFSEQELTCYSKLYNALLPKAKAKHHMEMALHYMANHVCERSSSVPVDTRQLEFNFNWEAVIASDETDNAAGDKAQSEVQWNFSNLDRSDRIHMIYNTLYDSQAKLSQHESISQLHYREKFGTSLEQVISEDPESQLIPVAESGTSISSRPILRGQSPKTSNTRSIASISNPNTVYNLDLKEHLVSQEDKALLQHEETTTQNIDYEAIRKAQENKYLDHAFSSMQVKKAPEVQSTSAIGNTKNSASVIGNTIKLNQTLESELDSYNGQKIQIQSNGFDNEAKTVARFSNATPIQESQREASETEEVIILRQSKQVVPTGPSNIVHAEISEAIDLFNHSQNHMISQESRIEHQTPVQAPDKSFIKSEPGIQSALQKTQSRKPNATESESQTVRKPNFGKQMQNLATHSMPNIVNASHLDSKVVTDVNAQNLKKHNKTFDKRTDSLSKPQSAATFTQKVGNQAPNQNCNDIQQILEREDVIFDLPDSESLRNVKFKAQRYELSQNPSSSFTNVRNIVEQKERPSLQPSNFSGDISTQRRAINTNSDNRDRIMSIMNSQRGSDITQANVTDFANIRGMLHSMRNDSESVSQFGKTQIAESMHQRNIEHSDNQQTITDISDKSPVHQMRQISTICIHETNMNDIQEEHAVTEHSVEAQGIIKYNSQEGAIPVVSNQRSSPHDERTEKDV